MNRRDSLKALGLIAAGSGVLASACKDEKGQATKVATEGSSDMMPGVQEFEHKRTEALKAEKFFTEHEMATITVLADIIIPKDDVSGSASEAGVPAFIEFMSKDIPSYQTPLRGGLKWLDVQCQKTYGNAFIKCKKDQQIAMIDEIAYPQKAKPEMAYGVAFFSMMRDLTSTGFFTSEMGVKDIGYKGNTPGVWNGVPADVLAAHGFDPNKFFG
ncbi:gluconate 2-dehydrogenase subunit 3 family protein [Sphingobacterium daejeonense]|uniref:gluconate 2-dehydrogenase subunit 3 family protein n=1 Tax=Sphingobacterium daejeonense TaxID=371142 RepID=UPI0021A74D51|nr:gluconate 2-dehydrogenase subunit 3 family protein [Sphingobacterium daejeonense]MCT1532211.1 gluconate 2-dehydrogenase subunit 3 family protein [Sphingobacterium daejeonense]